MSNVELIMNDDRPPEEDRAIPVTAVVRLKHGILHKLSQACGSQSEAARQLGVTASEYGRWVNFKERPSRRWDEARAVQFASKIFELTGHTVDEIWPDWLDECLGCVTVGEQTREFTSSEIKRLASPYETPVQELTHETGLDSQLEQVLKSLTYREREVIKMRFGIGGKSHGLSEVGAVFKITQERVRQIESKALRKLQHPIRSDRLRRFVPGHDEQPELPASRADSCPGGL